MNDNIVAIGMQIFFQAANFIILFLLLKKLLWKPVKGFMEKRQKEIQETIENADNSRAEAIKLKKQYEAQIANAKLESRDILEQANRRADKNIAASRQEAKEQGDKLIKKAQEEIRLEKEKAFAELRDEVSVLSVSIAEKIIQETINAKSHEKLVDDYIEQVGRIS